MSRSLLVVPFALVLAVGLAGESLAQLKVHTQSIKQPTANDPASAPPLTTGSVPKPEGAAHEREEPTPELILDLSRLPAPVIKTRERLLTAARSGDLKELVTLMQGSGTAPIFSLNDDKDPISFWKANYPDSEGVEVLAILIEILESGAVHVDKGTPQDMYVWPYFARMPLKGLNAAQKVELFKIITGNDYKDMLSAGAYNFYRLGISPDGTWQFFVAGD